MRRPMVFCGILFSGFLFLFMQLHPLWWDGEQRLPEGAAYLEGTVYEKEYRMQSGKKVPVLFLKDAVMYEVMPDSGDKTGNSRPKKIPCHVMCYMRDEDAVPKLGRRILVCGKIKNFQPATNAGEFDSAKYYQILGIGASLREASVVEQCGRESILQNSLYDIKEYASLLLHAVLDGEDASVMGSLLLGESALLDQDIKSLYKRSGIIHILAISGMHISLLGMGVFRLLKKCAVPVAVCAGAASVTVILFGLMTGFGPSSLRAVVMFVLQMAAYLLGRTYDLPTGLSVAAVLVLGMQPLYLYHSGFMLSFLSVASLIMLQPVFAELFPGAVAAGMAIFIGTLPVHAWYYFEAPPYAMFLNLLIVPCMPVLMIFGGILLAVGAVYLPAAAVPAWGIHWLLQFYQRLSTFSLKLPGSGWIIGKPAAYQVILYLTILVSVIFAGKHLPVMWSRMMLCLAVFVLTVDLHMGLQIVAVDVGQGDCFLVTDHRGTEVLIDGGSSSRKNTGKYQIEPVLKYNGVGRLQAVFISHLDSDHYNGILEMIEDSDAGGVEIGCIYVSAAASVEGEVRNGLSNSNSNFRSAAAAPVLDEADDGKYSELVRLAAAHEIPVETLSKGAVYRSGRLELTCLYPPEDAVYGSADESNENSMVLYLQYGNFSALFTGDLEGKGERAVAESCRKLLGNRRLTVLKAAHHGSKNASSSEFLGALRPQLVLLSVGADNHYGHPHAETLSRLQETGARVYRTDECGEITVRVRSRIGVRGETDMRMRGKAGVCGETGAQGETGIYSETVEVELYADRGG